MILEWVTLLGDFPGANLFRYISFRTGMGALTALVLALWIGRWWIPWVRKRQFTQAIRDDGPATHKQKEGTPTMGGGFILLSVGIALLLWGNWHNRFVIYTALALLGFGLLGGVDDYLKVIRRHPRGVTARQKLFFQTVMALVLGLLLYLDPLYSTRFYLPFYKYPVLDLGWVYVLLITLVVVGSSNAVNLTDGLDGLAIGIAIMVIGALGVVAYCSGNVKIAQYLLLPYISPAGEVTVVAGILVGAGIGFLWYNAYPAEIFMGDIGSLPLGAVIGLMAAMVKQELLLVLIGGIFVVEAISVMLQVFWYKRFGRRIFRMAPLHHHFELMGWHEVKVVTRFWIVAFIFVVLGLISLKVR